MEWDTLEKLERRAERVVENTRGLMESLIALRKEHELSQGELAERMGVSQSAVSQMERYDANPTISSIERYAIAVGAKVTITVASDRDNWTPKQGVSAGAPESVQVKPLKPLVGTVDRISPWTEPTVTKVS